MRGNQARVKSQICVIRLAQL